MTLNQNSPDAAPDKAAALTVEKLIYGGQGLGRTPEGRIQFVPFSVPGESGVADDTGWVTLETPAPERVTPPCSVFGECGGCQWQHVALDAQRHWKTEIVRESLTRLGGVQNPPVAPILAGDGFQYRNHVQWAISRQGELGYHGAKSNDVVVFDTCHLLPAPMQQLAEFLKLQPLRGLTRISVRMNAQDELMVWLQGKAIPALIEALKAQVAGLVVNEQVVHGKAFFNMTVGAHRYRVSAQSFFQVNTAMAEAMLGVLDAWFPDPIDSLADVYCGVGLFAKHLAGRVRGTVYGFESSETAYADAQANALRVKLRLGPVERSLARLEEKVAVAVVDPPRGGCSKPVIAWLNQQVTEHVVLVSCDPTTLARDLQRLSDQWALEAVQPLDMFPQTYHVEAMALLRRRTK